MNTSYIKYLVLEGGGIKGKAFLGALEYLYEEKILDNIKGVAASSAGTPYAVAIACKVKPSIIKEIMQETDFASFKDDSWGYVLDIARLINQYGICKGDALYNWIGDMLKEFAGSDNITFQQLFNKTGVHLVITGTNLNKKRTEYFSHETTPNMEVRLAVRISTSLPLFFKCVKMNGDLYIDGGVLNNYPIWYFDKYHDRLTYNTIEDCINIKTPIQTLGLKLMSDKEYETVDGGLEEDRQDIYNIKDFLTCLIDAILLEVERGYIKPGYWERTVRIETGDVSTTSFDLNDEKTNWLISQGYNACRKKLKEIKEI